MTMYCLMPKLQSVQHDAELWSPYSLVKNVTG